MTLFLLILSAVIALACIQFLPGGIRIGKWLLRALVGLLSLALALYGVVAFVQYLAGCPSLFGDCYNSNLPNGWSINKPWATVSLLCWLALAVSVILTCAVRIFWRSFRSQTTANLTLRQPLPPEQPGGPS